MTKNALTRHSLDLYSVQNVLLYKYATSKMFKFLKIEGKNRLREVLTSRVPFNRRSSVHERLQVFGQKKKNGRQSITNYNDGGYKTLTG